MQVQVNTDSSVERGPALVAEAEAAVESALARFGDRITRVEVHLSDANRGKSGAADKQCVMEARVAGRAPVAVRHQADAFGAAVSGAADKLQRALDSALGRASHY